MLWFASHLCARSRVEVLAQVVDLDHGERLLLEEGGPLHAVHGGVGHGAVACGFGVKLDLSS